MLNPDWAKPELCGSNACVEVRAAGPDTVEVRDSKDPEGPRLSFTAHEWTSFMQAARDGQYDI